MNMDFQITKTCRTRSDIPNGPNKPSIKFNDCIEEEKVISPSDAAIKITRYKLNDKGKKVLSGSKKTINKKIILSACGLLACGLFSSNLALADSSWFVQDGSWSNSVNWSNGIPNSSGVTAYFYNNFGPSSITLDNNYTVGVLYFNSINTYTIAPGNNGTLTLDYGLGTAEVVNDVDSSQCITAPIIINSNTEFVGVDSNALINVSSNISGLGNINIYDASTIFTGSNTYIGSSTITSGSLSINGAGSLPNTPVIDNGCLNINANTSITSISGTGSVVVNNAVFNTNGSIGGINLSNGSLNIGSGSLQVNYSNNDPVFTIRQYLKSAYDNKEWDGIGLTSNYLKANHQYAIGYVDSGSSLTYMPALIGDANLDGSVDFIDLGIVAQNLGSITGTWSTGDFNYDGEVNFLDIGLLAQNLNSTTLNTPLDSSFSISFISQWCLAVAEVNQNRVIPEPSCLLLFGGLSLMRRRS